MNAILSPSSENAKLSQPPPSRLASHAVGSGLERIHDVNGCARRATGIVAIDRLRRIDDTVARAIPGDPCHPHVPGGEDRYRLRRDILPIDPEHLVAALAARKDEIVSLSRLIRRVADGVGKIRERPRRGPRHGHRVRLGRGIEPTSHQDLAALWMPRQHTARAKFSVWAKRRRQRSRNRGNAVRDQRGRRRDERFLGEGALENNQTCSNQEDSANCHAACSSVEPASSAGSERCRQRRRRRRQRKAPNSIGMRDAFLAQTIDAPLVAVTLRDLSRAAAPGCRRGSPSAPRTSERE